MLKKNYFRIIAFILCLVTVATVLNIPIIKSGAADTPVVAGIKSFQSYINSNLPSQYLGTPLAVNGDCGSLTKFAAVKLIQYYMNTTYGEALTVDGHFGPSSQIAFNLHKETIIYGETGFWVYILQGLLYCHGYNPNGFDGSYGSGGGTGCLNATQAYKIDYFIMEYLNTGTVGVETMASLCWKTSLAQKTFYVRNKGNGQYLSKSYSNSVVLTTFNGDGDSSRQKWQLQYFENGEFRLINLSDATPFSGDYTYALSASSSATVTLQAGNTTLSNQKWIISGAITNFKLVSKAYNTKALRAASSTTVSLADLSSTDTSWELIEASNPYVLPYIQNNTTVDKFDKTDLKARMNCYSYILGYFGVYENVEDPYNYEDQSDMLLQHLQPGNISGRNNAYSVISSSNLILEQFGTGTKTTIDNEGTLAWVNAIIDRTDTDLNVFHEEASAITRIYPSSLGERIVGPWKKVALVIDNISYNFDGNPYSNFDYHWLIQHEDGKWSHKRGLSDALVVDAGGNTIYDPAASDFNFGDFTNYSYFAGYFKVRTDAIYCDGFRDHSSDDNYKWDNAGDIASMANTLAIVSAPQYQVIGGIEYYNTDNSNYESAYSLNVNSYSWKGDIDWFEFMTTVSGVYTIETTGIVDTFGAIYQGDLLIDYDDDIDTSNRNFSMDVYLSSNTRYSVRISGYNDLKYGKYFLYINRQ